MLATAGPTIEHAPTAILQNLQHAQDAVELRHAPMILAPTVLNLSDTIKRAALFILRQNYAAKTAARPGLLQRRPPTILDRLSYNGYRPIW